MESVVHFEIHVTDPERAITFYTALFGWEIKKWDSPAMEYWMVTTKPKEGGSEWGAINGGLMRRQGPAPTDGQPVNASVNTVGVKDIDATLAKLQTLGGKIAVPKMPIPGMGWLAYAKDTEGNLFGMMQSDPTVK